MNVLFIGGSGLISTAVSKKVIEMGYNLYVLNRGNNNHKLPKEANILVGDIYNEGEITDVIKDLSFDVVVEWIAFAKEHVQRDYRLFKGKTKQYIFISSASAYIKPLPQYPITEDVPLGNKYWEYSDNKRVCEEYLQTVNDKDFNVTIVRPAHTYDDDKIVACLKSWSNPYTTIHRILSGKPIIIPGNGNSLWTLTYNKDFAEAFVMLLGNKKTYGEAYHLTSDFVYTWERINEILCDILGVTPNVIHIPSDFIIKYAPHYVGELKGDKDWSLVFDNSKIKSIAPDYKAKTKYEDIAPKAVQYYLDNKELQTIDQGFEDMLDNIIKEYQK